MKVENGRYGITYKSRRIKQQPKSKIRAKHRRHPPFADPCMLSNGNEVGGLKLGVAMNNRRTSKLPPRKKRKCEPYVEVPEISASDEIETTNGDGIIFKRSTRGTEYDSGSDNDAKQVCSSSLPNSISDAWTLGGKAMKSRKRSIRRPRKKCSDLSFSRGNHPFATSHKGEGALQEFRGSNLDADPSGELLYDFSQSFEENSELECGAKQVEESHDDPLALRCLSDDGLESRNFRPFNCHVQGKKKGRKGRDVDDTNKLAEAEEDDSMTLAAFIKKSVGQMDLNSNESGAIPEQNVHTPTASRCCGIQGNGNGNGVGLTPSSTSEAGGIMDDMPLAHFFNTLKSRVKPASQP